MSWISPRKDPEALAALRRARDGFPPEYGRPDPSLPEAVRRDSIVGTHSLLPGVAEPLFGALRGLFDPALPLSRRQHETIATVVSALNRCFY